MSEVINTQLLKLKTSIHTIANQEIPVLPTSPVYRLFEVRKEIAINILRSELNSQEEEMMIDLIDQYNSNIKKFFLL